MEHRESEGPEVLIVGNYLADGQESMLRFGRVLLTGLRARGMRAELIVPGRWFGRLRGGTAGLGKWLAYLDKYVLFPWRLRRRVRGLGARGVVHLADHSNAVYTLAARSAGHPVVVTCHDLGAVRGALGEDTDCAATRMGRVLQSWITRSLGQADMIACVSTATQADVHRLVRRPDGKLPRTTLVPMGLNVPYGRLDAPVARTRLRAAVRDGFDPAAPFVLNVGSNLPRKNRAGALRIFAEAARRWPEGQLVFAGQALTPDERRVRDELGLAGRVTEFVKPSDAELEALYNAALCLLFPSKFEGFGWPAAEAQACGCPVLCSDAGSLPEVVGDSAFVRPYTDEAAFAAEVLRLAYDDAAREMWRGAGEQNAEKFLTATMLDHYGWLYDELIGKPAARAVGGAGAGR